MSIKKIIGKESELLGADTRLYIKNGDTIKDSSGQEHIISKFGGITNVTSKFGKACAYFDGDGDYLTVPDSADWDIFANLTDSWTIDFWARLTTTAVTHYAIDQYEDASNSWGINHQSSGWAVWLNSSTQTNWITTRNGGFNAGEWGHVAIIKVADKVGVYENGVNVSSITLTSANIDTFSGQLEIGSALNGTSGTFLNGNLDEIRIQNSNIFSASPDSGLTDTITVPTSEHVADADTKLLMHFNENLEDSSLHPHTVTPTGSPILSYPKFGTNCIEFNGLTQYLSIPYSTEFNMFASNLDNWVLDFWIKPDSLDGTIISNKVTGYTNDFMELSLLSGNPRFMLYEYGVAYIYSIIGNKSVILGEWNHISLCKYGDEIGIYLNEEQIAYATSTKTATFAYPLIIGAGGDGPEAYTRCAIDELRIINDDYFSARPNSSLTDTITIPTTEYTSDVNTKLLLHLNDNLIDSGNTGHTVTAYNNPNYSTHKFGVASALFDGLSDYLTVPDSPDWDIHGSSSDSWTIDFWFNQSVAKSGGGYVLSQYEDGSNRWAIIIKDGLGIQLYSVGSGGLTTINMYTDSTTEASSTNEWHHVALVKSGSVYAFYVDGSQESYVSNSTTDTFSGYIIVGARDTADTVSLYNGNIDDMRIQKSNIFNASPNSSKTDTITVPTTEHVADADTKLLMHFNENLEDSSPNSHIVTKNGDVATIPYFQNTCMFFDGVDDYISMSYSSDWDFMSNSSDNRTIDFFIKFSDISNNAEVIVQNGGDSTQGYWQLHHSPTGGGWRFASWYPQGIPDSSYVGQISDRNWHHMALIKVGSIYALYKDGIQLFYINSTNIVTYTNQGLTLGTYPWSTGSSMFKGFIDSLRFSKSNIFSVTPDSGLTSTLILPNSVLSDEINKIANVSKGNIGKIFDINT